VPPPGPPVTPVPSGKIKVEILVDAVTDVTIDGKSATNFDLI